MKHLLATGALLAGAWTADAETLNGALAKAYRNNQALNIARTQVRATDENVPQAKSGLRPFVSGVGDLTGSQFYTKNGDNLPDQHGRSRSASFGIQINQTLFDGFQTPNNVRSAEAQVKAAQQNLSNTEQNTLTDTVSAYMNVLRDRQIATLRRQNLAFLEEQVRASQARFDVGEGTRTDVAQAESERALATALLNSALSQVASSEATYFQVVGDAPQQLAPGRSIGNEILPGTVVQAANISQREHPAILATLYAVDAAAYQVKSQEGQTLPQLSVTGAVQNTYQLNDDEPDNLPGVDVLTNDSVNATVSARLTIPIYQGGLVSSQIRQAKETLGQRQIEVDQTRDQVRAAVTTSWAAREAARANVIGYDAQVRAARLALNGVIEERNVGQRTTLDVLNAQADVITAQILLVGAQRDEVVTSYTLASAIGRLSADRLRLNAPIYNANEHYKAVKNKWSGRRTPDGR